MNLRERRDQQHQNTAAPGVSDDGGMNTQALRDESQTFLAAADDAINRALSRNSSEFLAQNRQQGGQ